ncbi:innexin inx2-like [Artemia franciscana]
MSGLPQLFGSAIHCTTSELDLEKSGQIGYFELYCWIHSKFILPETSVFTNHKIGVDIAYPGIGPYTTKDKAKSIKYYEFVVFFLLLQALLFYIPRYIWRMWESNRMEMLLRNLDLPIDNTDKRKTEIKLVLNHLEDYRGENKVYVSVYFICELLNCLNVLFQAYIVNVFLGYEFTTYGSHVAQFLYQDPEERLDPMARVFPKQTKCTFHAYGSSGSIQRRDIFCLLPLNNVNEKIYVFMWFWFVVLFSLSLLAVTYRLIFFFSTAVRRTSLGARARLVSDKQINIVSQKCEAGDLFLLILLAKNMDPVVFRELINNLTSRFYGSELPEIQMVSDQSFTIFD